MGCAAVFPAASSVGVARSPRVGVPFIPCVVSGGWWACAGVIRTASGSRFGGVCRGLAPQGVVRCPLGVGGRWSLRRGMPFLCLGPGARRDVLRLCAPVPVPSPLWPLGGFLLPRCVAPGALSLGAPACYRGRFRAPLPDFPPVPLAHPLPVPFPFPVWWWWGGGGGGAGGPGLGVGGLEPLAEGFRGCRGSGGPGPHPGGGPPMPPAA